MWGKEKKKLKKKWAQTLCIGFNLLTNKREKAEENPINTKY